MIWLRHIIRDLRFAFRILRKNPGFTALVVLTLGLGIGVVSTFFGLFDALVIHPYPYPDADRVVYLWSNIDSSRHLQQPLSFPDFEDIREQCDSFTDFGAFSRSMFSLGLESPVTVCGIYCTPGVLRTFGMQTFLGRLIEEADDKTGAPPVAVISHSMWKRVFGEDPQTVGKTVRIDGRATTVVGVLPPDFEYQPPWHQGEDIDLWIPLSHIMTIREPWRRLSRISHWLLCVGRLRNGVTFEEANAGIKTIGARLSAQYPDSNLHKPFQLKSLWRQATEKTASSGVLLLGTVVLLLLVACANVAGILLARGAGRQGEFGARLALGGTRSDIFRLLLCESLLLALAGCIVGIILAKWGLMLMQYVIPSTLIIAKRREALELNSLLLAFSLGLSVLSGLISGLAPAFSAARTPVAEILKGDGRSQTASLLRHRFLRRLVAVQIAVTMVMGSGAILLAASYFNVLDDNLTLNTDQVITASFSLSDDRYTNASVQNNFLKDLFDQVRSLPGVVNVAVTSKLPLTGHQNFGFLVDNEQYDPLIKRPLADRSYITFEYFAAMGISLICGRLLGPEDGGTEVQGVVINQTMANMCWPGQDPIGKTIRSNSADPWFRATVVGVVTDVRQRDAEYPVGCEIYFLHAFYGDPDRMALVVKTSGDARWLIPSLRQTVSGLDPDLALYNVRTMKELLAKTTGERRLLTQLVVMFMAFTLSLTMVGVYGTFSNILLQRRREVGIRLALGAMRRDIMKYVFRQAAAWVVMGLAAGLLLMVILSFFIQSAFFGVSPLNPLFLLLGLVAVGASAGAACFFPACRAIRLDPMEALRCD